MTIEKLQSVFTKKGFIWNPVFNIIAVRNASTANKVTNVFDDTLYVAYKELNAWKLKEYIITTDPGLYYTKIKLLNPKGVAIVVEGQYINSHQIGLHQGKYEALVQRNNLKVARDGNKNDIYDFGITEVGSNFGINIHCAGENSEKIDNFSGGCIVFKRKANFLEFMKLCNLYKTQLNNKFTLTLINSNDLV